MPTVTLIEEDFILLRTPETDASHLNKLLLYENLLNLRATGPLQLRFRMVGWLDKERNLALSLQGEGKREESEERIIKATCFDLRRAFSSPLVFVCRRAVAPLALLFALLGSHSTIHANATMFTCEAP